VDFFDVRFFAGEVAVKGGFPLAKLGSEASFFDGHGETTQGDVFGLEVDNKARLVQFGDCFGNLLIKTRVADALPPFLEVSHSGVNVKVEVKVEHQSDLHLHDLAGLCLRFSLAVTSIPFS
jgi:hypothetical protein